MKKQNNNSHFRPPLIMTIVAVCLVALYLLGFIQWLKITDGLEDTKQG